MKSPFRSGLFRLLANFSVVIVVVFLCVSAAIAQPSGPPSHAPWGASGPPTSGGGTVGGLPVLGGVIPNIKTPPMFEGQPISIPIAVHNPGPLPLANWAGVLVEVHVADATEVDVAAVTLAPGNFLPVPSFPTGPIDPLPFGPLSASNATSSVKVYTALHPAWPGSGVLLPPSAIHPAITLNLIAKNTSQPNSDVDVTLRFADIYHIPSRTITVPGNGSTIIPGSTTFLWPQSMHVFVQSNINDQQDLHIAPGQQTPLGGQASMYRWPQPGEPNTGHWIHVQESILWHVVDTHVSAGQTRVVFPGSLLIAMPFAASATIGIEHIPEPTSAVLMLGAIGAVFCGMRARRRRLQA